MESIKKPQFIPFGFGLSLCNKPQITVDPAENSINKVIPTKLSGEKPSSIVDDQLKGDESSVNNYFLILFFWCR